MFYILIQFSSTNDGHRMSSSWRVDSHRPELQEGPFHSVRLWHHPGDQPVRESQEIPTFPRGSATQEHKSGCARTTLHAQNKVIT